MQSSIIIANEPIKKFGSKGRTSAYPHTLTLPEKKTLQCITQGDNKFCQEMSKIGKFLRENCQKNEWQ